MTITPPDALPTRLPAAVLDTGVIAVLRPTTVQHLDATMSALVESGVRCIEITATTPDFLGVLARLAQSLPPDVAIGLGTVTDLDTGRAAIDAGVQFLVTPGLVPGLPAVADEAEVATVIGAWTPSEVIRALGEGATAVKVFPASTGGVAHLRSLREPFPAVPFVPSGGLTLESAPDYVRVGAIAVGLGGALTGSALRDGDAAEIVQRAPALLAAVAAARGDR